MISTHISTQPDWHSRFALSMLRVLLVALASSDARADDTARVATSADAPKAARGQSPSIWLVQHSRFRIQGDVYDYRLDFQEPIPVTPALCQVDVADVNVANNGRPPDLNGYDAVNRYRLFAFRVAGVDCANMSPAAFFRADDGISAENIETVQRALWRWQRSLKVVSDLPPIEDNEAAGGDLDNFLDQVRNARLAETSSIGLSNSDIVCEWSLQGGKGLLWDVRINPNTGVVNGIGFGHVDPELSDD